MVSLVRTQSMKKFLDSADVASGHVAVFLVCLWWLRTETTVFLKSLLAAAAKEFHCLIVVIDNDIV